MESPTFMSSDGIISDKEYIKWLSDVKNRLHSSRVKAAVQVNSAMLEFYWGLGRDLAEIRVEQKYGAGVIKQLSLDLRADSPDAKGLSVDNLYFMRRWYEFYKADFSHYPEIFDQVGQIFRLPRLFTFVPWCHHVEIVKIGVASYQLQEVVDRTVAEMKLKAKSN